MSVACGAGSGLGATTPTLAAPANPYAGDLLSRPRLTGDWWGVRSDLSDRGLTFDFFATQFYADVEGHPEDRSLVFAFEELAFYSKEMKILGVYPAHPFRMTFAETVRPSP